MNEPLYYSISMRYAVTSTDYLSFKGSSIIASGNNRPFFEIQGNIKDAAMGLAMYAKNKFEKGVFAVSYQNIFYISKCGIEFPTIPHTQGTCAHGCSFDLDCATCGRWPEQRRERHYKLCEELKKEFDRILPTVLLLG